MRIIKLLITIFFLFQVTPVIADPDWYSSNMKESDCENTFWKETSMCYDEYYIQQSNKLNAYIKDELLRLSEDKRIIDIFEGRESSWQGYSQSYCALQTYCPDSWCGSGYSSSVNGCIANQRKLRNEFLKNEIRNGIETHYGNALHSKETRTLITSKFEISLSASCELGFFDCDSVQYLGVNKKTGDKISLTGKTYEEFDPQLDVNVPRGSVFINGDTQYSVSNTGVLKVTHNGKVLVNEKGVWKK